MFKFVSVAIISLSLNIFYTKALANPPAKNAAYFELKVYQFTNSGQEATIDSFLQYQYLPAVHAAGIHNIGIFKAIANDTTAEKKLYVFLPFTSLKDWEKFSLQPAKNEAGDAAGTYSDAPYNAPVFTRMETIFLRAFELMPGHITAPKLNGPLNERVYELRSYESASENIYRNKVKMFNQGGEIDIFSRLGFNPVFYSEVLFGSKMPNLMYMTSFDNMKSRDEHWKAFGSDQAWKTLSGMKEYQNNISHSDIMFLRPTAYSEL